MKFRQLGLTATFAITSALGWGAIAGQSVAAAQLPAPECRYDDVLTQHHDRADWRISLLDTIYMVSRNYAPTRLVSVSRAGIEGSGKVRPGVISDLAAMAKAARQAGAPLRVTSAYRDWSHQKYLYQREVEKFGLELGRQKVARPGHSEHQLGTALDFSSGGSSKSGWQYDDWGDTAAGTWVRRNGWKFGFVLSYPEGQTGVTCYIYEPWHYRYVGREMAADIHASGLTVREYLWKNFE